MKKKIISNTVLFILIGVLGLCLSPTITDARQIIIDETLQINKTDFTKVVVFHPNLVTITENSTSFIIKPKEISQTTLYLWNTEGQLIVEHINIVSTSYDNYQRWKKNLKYRELKREKPEFDVVWAHEGGFGNSKSDFSSTTYSYRWDISKIKVGGDIPWGRLSQYYQIEGRDDTKELSMFQTIVKNDAYHFQLGDVWMSGTPLIGSLFSYQGVALTNLSLVPDTKVNMYTGSTGKTLWGSNIQRGTPNKNNFIGFQATTPIDRQLTLKSSYYTVTSYFQTADQTPTDNKRYTMLSLLGNFRVDPIVMNLEYAQGNQDKAGFYFDATYARNNIWIKSNYMSVDNHFTSLFDIYNRKGYEGLQNQMSVQVLPHISTSLGYEYYKRKTISNDPIQTIYTGVNFNKPLWPLVSVQYRDSDFSAYPTGGRSKSLSLLSTYTLKEIGTSVYGKYFPSYGDIFSLNRGLNHRGLMGIKFVNMLTYINNELGFESKKAIIVNSNLDNDTGNGSLVNSNSYKFELGLNPLTFYPIDISRATIQTRIRYESETYLDALQSRYIGYDADLSLYDVPLFGTLIEKVFLTYSYDFEQILFNSEMATLRNSYNWKMGVTHHFNTNILLKGKEDNSIQGYVYYDQNRNGYKDASEKGLEGITVKSDNMDSVTTPSGFFKLSNLETPWVVIETTTHPNMTVFYENPIKIDFSSEQHLVIDIPVTFDQEYWVIIYHDVNNDNIYQENIDALIPNVILTVEDNMNTRDTVFNPTGIVSFIKDIHNKKATIQIHLDSVPESFIPSTTKSHLQEIDVSQSENTFYFPFKTR